ncbi:MAG: putative spermidine/putrescine transport system ATP-binding protein [Solirubrobacteraceae bacterium]|nr:putative spermidine/putrescine transport system ATP-binding protein [Solirubrobacteraceae bacterium]
MSGLAVSESDAGVPSPAPATAPPDVRLSSLRKSFGDVAAVDGVDLDVAAGEFFTLLGPSGSGKTTTLRLIAGFERPDAGRIELAGEDVTDRPPNQRDVNTVFQDYALFPHMSVADNVAYGLRVRKIAKAERAERVAEALRMVQLEGFGDRRPVQLSGGQRQRVALARAIINRPRVLLLDEPLGALDLKLRQQMQIELKGIQDQVGITFVYVTHDQDEALAMSDRIAVFTDGRIEQVAPPADLYERPATSFVAGFVGTSNTLARGGRRFTLRPEKVHIVDPDTPLPGGFEGAVGRIRDVVYLGMVTRYVVELDDGTEILAVAQNQETSSQDALEQHGRRVRVQWRHEHTITIDDG